MGFSIFSVIELFYFVSIRPCFDYLRISKRRKEIIAKLTSKEDNLCLRADTPVLAAILSSNSNVNKKDPRPYLE